MKKIVLMVLEIAMAFVTTVAGLALLPRADGTCLLAAGLVLGFGAVMHYAKTGTLSPWVTRGTAAALVIVALCMPSTPAKEKQQDVRMISPPEMTSTTVMTTRVTTAPTTALTTTPTTTPTTKTSTVPMTTTAAATTTSTVPMTTTAAPVIAWTEPTTTASAVSERSAPEETTAPFTDGTKVSLANTSIVIPEARYVLNTNSKIIHNPWCQSVQAISQKNYQETNATIEELEAMGYRKCRMHGDWDD